MVWGGIAHGIKLQLIIVAGNMTAVRYRDEILRPVAVPLVQQRNLILQQDNQCPTTCCPSLSGFPGKQ